MSQGPEHENYPPRTRWVGWLIAIGMIAVVCGLLSIGWRLMQA